MSGVHFAAVVVFAMLAVAILALGIVAIIKHIITKRRIEELKRAHGGMKVATSWISCREIRDASNTFPVTKSEHVAVDLPIKIVRCRDCKRSPMCDLNPLGGDVNPDGFCAWGERRDA